MPKLSPLFVSNLVVIRRAHEEMAANIVRSILVRIVNRAKANAMGGFKGGAFTTGGWRKISYRFSKINGEYVGDVGHPDRHFGDWEFGHYNVYTRHWERHQWLYPAMLEELHFMGRVSQDVIDEVMRRYSALTRVL